jgi:hypothetical protein
MLPKLTCRWFVVVVVGGLVSAPAALAQPRYYPQNGPISPWMNIFQRQPGPLDNYHSYVRPEFQLRNTLGMQNAALQQQAAGLQLVGQNQQAGQIAATGTGSVFMNLSHYYPSLGGWASSARSRGSSGAAVPAGSGRSGMAAGSRGSSARH